MKKIICLVGFFLVVMFVNIIKVNAVIGCSGYMYAGQTCNLGNMREYKCSKGSYSVPTLGTIATMDEYCNINAKNITPTSSSLTNFNIRIDVTSQETEEVVNYQMKIFVPPIGVDQLDTSYDYGSVTGNCNFIYGATKVTFNGLDACGVSDINEYSVKANGQVVFDLEATSFAYSCLDSSFDDRLDFIFKADNGNLYAGFICRKLKSSESSAPSSADTYINKTITVKNEEYIGDSRYGYSEKCEIISDTAVSALTDYESTNCYIKSMKAGIVKVKRCYYDSAGNLKSGCDYLKITAKKIPIPSNNGQNGDDYTPYLDYDNFCSNEGIKDAFRVIGYIIFIAKIIIPLIIIVLGMLDFGKAITTNDDKGLNKAINAFSRRMIAGVIVFFIPTIVYALMNIVGNVIDNTGDLLSNNNKTFGGCTKCLFRVGECGGKDGSDNSTTSNRGSGGGNSTNSSNNSDTNYMKN